MPEPSPLRRVCVYCGSRPGLRPAYAHAARQLGVELARRGIGLVTGGGAVGLMGAVANAALEGGGEATGVIPRAMVEREVGHASLTELRVVETMHQRKATMASLADAFVAMPGGLGTLEEIAEALTWVQLGIHAKPCAILDVEGYYAPLIDWLDGAVREGFVLPERRAAVVIESDPIALVDALEALAADSAHPGGDAEAGRAGADEPGGC